MKRTILAVFLGFLAALPVIARGGGTYDEVRKLVPKLGADTWKAREEAQEDIFLLFAKDTDPAVTAVAVAFMTEKDPEIKARLEKILHRMAPDHVRLGKRGFLGVSLGKLKGAVKVGEELYDPIDVVNVLPGTSAQAAGLVNGERILSIDEFKCTAGTTVEDVVKYISSRGPGAQLKFINLTPDNKVKARVIELGNRPSDTSDLPEEEIKSYMMEEWLELQLKKAAKVMEEEEKVKE